MRWSIKNLFKCAIVVIIILICCCFQSYTRFEKLTKQVYRNFSPVQFQQLPESKDHHYKIWRNVWKSNLGKSNVQHKSDINIGIATQCSVHNIHLVEKLNSYWNGPISVAIFTPGDDVHFSLVILKTLINCNIKLASEVSFHLVFPMSHPPYLSTIDINDVNALACSRHDFDDFISENNYDLKQVPYPVNLLRNVALQNLHTSHVFVSDIDMLPSNDLREQLLESSLLTNENAFSDEDYIFTPALVIPAFEVQSAKYIPNDKTHLIKLWNDGNIRPFYENVCWKCQKYTNYEQWRRTDLFTLKNTYQVQWHDPWEPFYITRKENVVYDERFEQYGFNRISQLCDLHMRGTTFNVVYSAYLLHMGFKEKFKFHASKDEENERNKIIYRKVKAEMEMKYPRSERHC